MKNLRLMYLMIPLLVLAMNDIAWSRGGHGHKHSHFNFGISVGRSPIFYGPGFYGPEYWGYRSFGYSVPLFNRPYYYSPPIAVIPVTPPVYIQREQTTMTQTQINYWHYCLSPEGYYPNVQSCPEGWIKVAPRSIAQ